MSFDERVFGWLWQRARAFRAQRADALPLLQVEAELRRLTVLASAIAERPLTLGLSATFDQAFIALPAGVPVIAGDVTLAEDLLLARVLFEAMVRRLGLCMPQGMPYPARCLATLLIVPHVDDALRAHLPGAGPTLDRASRFVASDRERTGWQGMSAPVRALIGQRLGVSTEDLAPLHGASQAWLERALAFKGDSAETLHALSLRLALQASEDFRRGLPLLWGPLPSAHVATPAELALATADQATRRGPSRTMKTRPHVEQVALEEGSLHENPFTHSFEKVHTLEEYQGGQKRADADDELGAHAEALDELELGHTMRSRQASAAFFESDLLIEGGGQDSKPSRPVQAFQYDEWNDKDRNYRRGFCTLREMPRQAVAQPQAAAWASAVLRARRREVDHIIGKFAQLEHERAWRNRQPEGPEVDVDAVVDYQASLRSGHTPADRLYSARLRHAPSLAVAMLIDASASSDAWVANRRVLDVSKECLWVLASALQRTQVPTHVGAFFSHTHRDVRYLNLKQFDEPWSVLEAELFALAPSGYTRIGPALRHTTQILSSAHAKRKLLLLLSDAKPTDYDAYEGRHGIGDVRQAVREAKQQGVDILALTIDSRERAHLPAMFGAGGYGLAKTPQALVGRIAEQLLERLR